MNGNGKNNAVLAGISIAFLLLAAAFVRDARLPAVRPQPAQAGTNQVAFLANPGHELGPEIALVDRKFIDPAPSRVSIAEALRKGADPSDYDCYLCHERNK